MNNQAIKRGEIYEYNFGKNRISYLSERRHVLILQDEQAESKSITVLAAPIIPATRQQYLKSHIILSPDCGLSTTSQIMLDTVFPAEKTSLGECVGSINSIQMWKRINAVIRKLLGMSIQFSGRFEEIRCLCPKCLREYSEDQTLTVRRSDPSVSVKDSCWICGNPGYDYYIKYKTINKKGR